MSFQPLRFTFSTSTLICLILWVSPRIFAQTVDVLITFTGSPNWDAMELPVTKADKGWFVYEKLTVLADQSQHEVRRFLEDRGIPYRAFVVTNAIHTDIPEALITEIEAFNGVERIVANAPFEQERVEMSEAISVRSVTPEWGILHMRVDSVWKLGISGDGVVIGGQDTGYEWQHSSLRDKYRGTDGDTVSHAYNWHDAIHEINPLNGDSVLIPENNPCGLDSPIPCDDRGHGTHTMGTMIGSDTANLIGVAPDAKWIACRNMERGWGTPATYLECMEWFLAPTDLNNENPDPEMAPHVINNSWSCPEIEGCHPGTFKMMRMAVANLRAAGVVVVVSAGNSGSECGSVSTPLAMFSESFTVGAININDTIAGFSSRGPVTVDSSFRMKPNVAAPGVQVRSAWLNNGYRNASGTSMAGPHVAGVVALMISANPSLAGQVETIETILENTARPRFTEQECGDVPGSEEFNNTFGHGVVDALAAVEAAMLVSSVEEIEVSEKSPIVYYPNPVSTNLHIASKSVHSLSELKLYSADGRLIRMESNVQLPAVITVDQVPPGLYFVRADQYEPSLIHIVR